MFDCYLTSPVTSCCFAFLSLCLCDNLGCCILNAKARNKNFIPLSKEKGKPGTRISLTILNAPNPRLLTLASARRPPRRAGAPPAFLLRVLPARPPSAAAAQGVAEQSSCGMAAAAAFLRPDLGGCGGVQHPLSIGGGDAGSRRHGCAASAGRQDGGGRPRSGPLASAGGGSCPSSSPAGAAFSRRPTHHGGHPESAPGMVAAGFSFAGGDLPEVVISSFAGGDRPASWLFWRISRFVS